LLNLLTWLQKLPSFYGSRIFDSGYRTIAGSLNLKPYSTISCNVTVTHEENAVGFVKTCKHKR